MPAARQSRLTDGMVTDPAATRNKAAMNSNISAGFPIIGAFEMRLKFSQTALKAATAPKIGDHVLFTHTVQQEAAFN